MVMSHEPTDAEVEALIEANPNGCTFEMIGATLGVTKVRAQQIVNIAIAKVLRRLNGKGVRRASDVLEPRHYSHKTTDSLYS